MLRAKSPRPPALSHLQERVEKTRRATLIRRLGVEQRSLLRGLILLALVVVLASLAHAGFGRLFLPGWWREW